MSPARPAKSRHAGCGRGAGGLPWTGEAAGAQLALRANVGRAVDAIRVAMRKAHAHLWHDRLAETTAALPVSASFQRSKALRKGTVHDGRGLTSDADVSPASDGGGVAWLKTSSSKCLSLSAIPYSPLVSCGAAPVKTLEAPHPLARNLHARLQ